jgi:hypothetical protein
MVFRFAARVLCAAGIALCLLAPGPARADDDPTIEMARQRFREGVQFYDQKQYEKARLAFLQAYALKPHPSVLLNLAQSELRADRPDDSANHFAEYLRTSPQGDAERQEAESGFAVAKGKTGEITVTAEPSGAQVIVDGQDKGIAPLPGPVYVVPGSHTVELRSSERKTSKVVVVGAGQAAAVSLSARGGGVEAAPVAPAASPQGEETPSEPTVGAVQSDASTGGRQSLPSWFGETPLAWVGAGVAVAGFTTGAVFAGLATKEYGTANNYKDQIETAFAADVAQAPELGQYKPCSQPPVEDLTTLAAKVRRAALDEKYDEYCSAFTAHSDKGDTNKTIAIIGTAVGGAAVIGTIIYYFVDSGEAAGSASKPSGFRARIIPGASGTAQGITILGVF